MNFIVHRRLLCELTGICTIKTPVITLTHKAGLPLPLARQPLFSAYSDMMWVRKSWRGGIYARKNGNRDYNVYVNAVRGSGFRDGRLRERVEDIRKTLEGRAEKKADPDAV